ncbi:MAG: cbb3-type cytochrome c oxidase subunit 3 [Calditrichaeota bacterium]|nr:cbb3-type cytochrome c oxidase subunit 3 [Calditrichota bacterium]MCB9368926.1 cbb3-type cytochrome c oxidase subunit 3 [Calditrichota bacterium]
MLRDILTNANHGIWPIVSLIIMFVAFAAVLIWTLSGRKNRFEEESNIPLHDEDDEQLNHSHSTRGTSS